MNPYNCFSPQLLLIVIATLVGVAGQVQAASTWVGTPNASTDFTLATKWSPNGAVDDAIDSRIFTNSGTAGTISDSTDANVPWAAVVFSGDNGSGYDIALQRWAVNAAGTFINVNAGVSNNETIRFNRVGSSNYLLIQPGSNTILNNGSGLLTIKGQQAGARFKVVTTASTTAADLIVDGTGDTLITADSGGVFPLQALEEDNSAHTVNLIKNGTGKLTLDQFNQQSSTTLNAGTLMGRSNTSAFGQATTLLSLNGGTLDVAMDSSVNAHNTTVGGNTTILSDRATSGTGITHTFGTLAIGANTLTIQPGASISTGTAGVAFGTTTLGGNATFNVDNSAAATSLTLGAVGESGGARALTKTGTGALILGSVNTYSGPTTVSNGTLLVNGSLSAASVVTVTGGTLGGNGTINGATTVQDGATLSPGNSVGTFQVGALTLASNATLFVEITNASNYDQVVASGAVSLDGSVLELGPLGYTPSNGDTLTILTSAASITGFFTNGTTVTGYDVADDPYIFDITYNANSIVLSYGVIPEPSTWALVALALVPLFLRRRQRAQK